MTDHPPVLPVDEFRDLGLLHEVNRLVLHPLGLAIYTDPASNSLGVFDMRDDPEGVYFHDETISPDKAEAVANLIEERGPARIEALGYVVQPTDPERKQLKVIVLESLEKFSLGAPGEIDEGEELELTTEPRARPDRIIQFDGEQITELSTDLAAAAAVVINREGVVLKDRYGPGSRRATDAELVAAERVS